MISDVPKKRHNPNSVTVKQARVVQLAARGPHPARDPF